MHENDPSIFQLFIDLGFSVCKNILQKLSRKICFDFETRLQQSFQNTVIWHREAEVLLKFFLYHYSLHPWEYFTQKIFVPMCTHSMEFDSADPVACTIPYLFLFHRWKCNSKFPGKPNSCKGCWHLYYSRAHTYRFYMVNKFISCIKIWKVGKWLSL